MLSATVILKSDASHAVPAVENQSIILEYHMLLFFPLWVQQAVMSYGHISLKWKSNMPSPSEIFLFILWALLVENVQLFWNTAHSSIHYTTFHISVMLFYFCRCEISQSMTKKIAAMPMAENTFWTTQIECCVFKVSALHPCGNRLKDSVCLKLMDTHVRLSDISWATYLAEIGWTKLTVCFTLWLWIQWFWA